MKTFCMTILATLAVVIFAPISSADFVRPRDVVYSFQVRGLTRADGSHVRIFDGVCFGRGVRRGRPPRFERFACTLFSGTPTSAYWNRVAVSTRYGMPTVVR